MGCSHTTPPPPARDGPTTTAKAARSNNLPAIALIPLPPFGRNSPNGRQRVQTQERGQNASSSARETAMPLHERSLASSRAFLEALAAQRYAPDHSPTLLAAHQQRQAAIVRPPDAKPPCPSLRRTHRRVSSVPYPLALAPVPARSSRSTATDLRRSPPRERVLARISVDAPPQSPRALGGLLPDRALAEVDQIPDTSAVGAAPGACVPAHPAHGAPSVSVISFGSKA